MSAVDLGGLEERIYASAVRIFLHMKLRARSQLLLANKSKKGRGFLVQDPLLPLLRYYSSDLAILALL